MDIIFKDFKIENNKYIYMPLYIFLKNKIEKKEISNRLPAIRKVSNFLNISTNTVAKAYLELEKINYIKSIKGSGFFIKEVSVLQNTNFNLENDDHFNSIQKLKIDFINSSPNFCFLPVKEIKYAINYILDRDQEIALISEGQLGSLELRKAILNSLDLFKISSHTDNIHILSGAQEGIDLISKTLAFPKDNILVEKPTYLGAFKSFKNQNLTIGSINLESDGLNILELEHFLSKNKIKFIYLMTNFQTPTGINLSTFKRQKLIELSEKFDFYIIEDDSSSDLYYSSDVPLPLKSLDKYDRIVYIKSFSKIFMPGFRLGFIIVPDKLLTSFLNNKILFQSNTSTLYQKSFALLLESGLIEKHISLSRKNFKDIQSTIVTELKKIPNINFSVPTGGCSLWIKLPDNISSISIFNKLLKDGVGIVPGDTYGFDNYIKLNFSRVTKSDAILGISLLKNTINFFENLEM